MNIIHNIVISIEYIVLIKNTPGRFGYVVDHPPAFGQHVPELGKVRVQENDLSRPAAPRRFPGLRLSSSRPASWRAGRLPPSPVMATLCPSACMDDTIVRFCSGLTRPNTVYSLATCGMSSSDIMDISIYLSAFLIPAFRATADTVSGLSPEITFYVHVFVSEV